MFYNNKWYIDHNELGWSGLKISNTEIKRYEPLFHKRKRTHTLLHQKYDLSRRGSSRIKTIRLLYLLLHTELKSRDDTYDR